MASRKNKKNTRPFRKSPARNRLPKKTVASPAAQRSTSRPAWRPVACFVAGWVMVLLAFFTRPQFWLLLPKGYPLRLLYLPYWPLLIGGFALMAFCSIRIPEESGGPDIPSFRAKLLFGGFLALTYFLRMNDADSLPALATTDHRFILSAARQVLDYSYHPLLFPPDFRPPFVTYAVAAAWLFLPKVTGVFAIRLVSTLMDLVTVWVMYLTGKEIGGRRMGLVLMFMAAASKSLLEATKYDLGINSAVMICALFFLFLLRVFKKPSLKHFLQLGLILGLGDYTYTPVRPWIPSILIGLLIWVLWGKQRRPKGGPGWALALGLGGAWTWMFLCKNTPLAQMFSGAAFFTQGWGGFLTLALLGTAFFLAWRQKDEVVTGWGAGALLAAFIEAPLWMDPGYNQHPGQVAIWSYQYHLTLGGALQQMGASFMGAFQYMFGNNGDLAVHPFLDRDCFMDYFVPIFGLAGLASFLTRPSWPKISILALFLVGILPVILSPGMMWPHLLGCMIPLFLIAGMGVYRLWQALSLLGRWGRVFGAFFLLLTGGFFLYKDIQWINRWESQRNPDLLAGEIIRQEAAPCRIYLVPFGQSFVRVVPDLISDGRDVHLGGPSNPVDLAPGENGKDLAVLTWVGDQASQERIQKDFPGAVWHETKSHYGYVELRWALIPFQSLTESPDKFFYLRRVKAPAWDRKFYSDYGLGRGMILGEDRVPHWNDSLPGSLVGNDSTARLAGTWAVATAGKYELEINTQNPTKVWVDGRLVLNVLPPFFKAVRDELNLAAGNHDVEMATAFKSQGTFPAVQVRSLGENWNKMLEDLSGMGPEEAPKGPAIESGH